ncbi:MAG: hypothetical protein AW06_003087 [Candidatus Accumulibacter cognatus]|uniref:Uncharacterized protein n=1 Tax=Candidatus Accumulibacter cognatus TaxID=2954383 RepID=A0A080MF58_9PROT|nr:MAG: hypothetical protein AW06_003087 [Candidatus Accumulibacter cognatus]
MDGVCAARPILRYARHLSSLENQPTHEFCRFAIAP